MPKLIIGSDKFEINEKQKAKLVELLKDYQLKPPYTIKEYSGAQDLVRIVVEGLIFELARQTYIQYRDMIRDIMRN